MRTIYRDVEALGAAGVPIHMERGPLGGIVLADGYRRAIAQFTSDELEALFASGPGPMTDFGITAQTQAPQKLAGTLPQSARRAVEMGRARVDLDHNGWGRGEQPTSALVRLRDAVQRDVTVRIGYRDRNGATSERRVDPLGLVAKAGVWYLIAREPEKGYRTFRAARISSVDVLTTFFDRPTDFNLEEYWSVAAAWIDRNSFESCVADLVVERDAVAKFAQFEMTVRIEDATSATLRIVFPSRAAAVSAILGLAAVIVTVRPDDLRREIVDRARHALARLDA